ncbi:protein of unknown function [Azospirillum baldaniorum]|uniref:Uncharacterized protein n=1 Tax=Azospirillum baldaniorum TaxID=1064539 RepID=A0A9P1NKX3_9PROT|nr:protein of unknown function [Azospirillum baldaniorum]
MTWPGVPSGTGPWSEWGAAEASGAAPEWQIEPAMANWADSASTLASGAGTWVAMTRAWKTSTSAATHAVVSLITPDVRHARMPPLWAQSKSRKKAIKLWLLDGAWPRLRSGPGS